MKIKPIEEEAETVKYAEQLLNDNKYTEALQVLIEFGKKKDILVNHRVACFSLQGRIFPFGRSD